MLHAAPLRIGNREEYARVVALFQDAGGGSHRQYAALLDVVYHLHRLTDPKSAVPLWVPRSPPPLVISLHTVYPPRQSSALFVATPY
jgi:hypothetical protein